MNGLKLWSSVIAITIASLSATRSWSDVKRKIPFKPKEDSILVYKGPLDFYDTPSLSKTPFLTLTASGLSEGTELICPWEGNFSNGFGTLKNCPSFVPLYFPVSTESDSKKTQPRDPPMFLKVSKIHKDYVEVPYKGKSAYLKPIHNNESLRYSLKTENLRNAQVANDPGFVKFKKDYLECMNQRDSKCLAALSLERIFVPFTVASLETYYLGICATNTSEECEKLKTACTFEIKTIDKKENMRAIDFYRCMVAAMKYNSNVKEEDQLKKTLKHPPVYPWMYVRDPWEKRGEPLQDQKTIHLRDDEHGSMLVLVKSEEKWLLAQRYDFVD